MIKVYPRKKLDFTYKNIFRAFRYPLSFWIKIITARAKDMSISNEKYDLLAVGRALLSDHEWVLKMQEGRIEDIIPYTKDALLKLY